MKVIYYERYARSDMHIHAGASTRCLYVPDRGVIIGSERIGFGANKFYVVRKPEILKEGIGIMNGETEQKPIYVGHPETATHVKGVDDSVTFSRIQHREVLDVLIDGLIAKIDSMNHLEEQVKLAAKDLFLGD